MHVIVANLHHNFYRFLQSGNGNHFHALNGVTWLVAFRYDSLFKTVFGSLTQTLLTVWNWANFACQPNFSENHQISRQRTVAKT